MQFWEYLLSQGGHYIQFLYSKNRLNVAVSHAQCLAVVVANPRLLEKFHAALFPTGRSGMHKITIGDWRTIELGQMQVMSSPIGK